MTKLPMPHLISIQNMRLEQKNPLQMFNVLLQVTVSAMVTSMMEGGSVEKFELRMTRAVANGQTPLPAFSPFFFCCYLKSLLP